MDEKLSSIANTKVDNYHAQTIVGYAGVEGVNDYYICQNSCGLEWCRGGYIMVRRSPLTSNEKQYFLQKSMVLIMSLQLFNSMIIMYLYLKI